MPSVPSTRRAAVPIVLLLLLALLAAACGGGGGGKDESNATKDPGDTSGKVADSGTPQPGGTLRFGTESDVATLDPAKALAQPSDRDIALAVYDPLMSYDEDGKLVPFLAESLQDSPDLKSYTLKLRSGVVFQDGTPFNADAVVAQFRRFKDPATNCICTTDLAALASIDKVDDLTVRFVLDGPQVGFPDVLAGQYGYMTSPTAVAKYGADYDRHPVGTGPFQLTEFASGDHVTVVKNPRYWRKDSAGRQLPYLDKIVFRPIPDSKQRISALQAGDVDLVQSADASTIKQAQSAGLKIQKISGSSSTIVMFNTKKPPVDDPRVRQALAYATDKKTVNEVVWGGLRTVAKSLFSTSSPYYDARYGNPGYDPEKAKALLKAYGKPVNIEVKCIPTPEAQQATQIIDQMWESVGVKITHKTEEQGQFVNSIYGSKDYQVACFRSAQFVEPDYSLYGGWHSGSPTNLENYSNKALDAALDKGRSTTDFATRKAAYSEFQREWGKDVPAITLAYDLFTNIYKPSVHGLPVPEANSLGAIKPATLWIEH